MPQPAQATAAPMMAQPAYANQLPVPGVGANDAEKAKQSWMAMGAGLVAWLVILFFSKPLGKLALVCHIGMFACCCYPVFVFWCQIPVTQRPAYPKTKTPAQVSLGLTLGTTALIILCCCILPCLGVAGMSLWASNEAAKAHNANVAITNRVHNAMANMQMHNDDFIAGNDFQGEHKAQGDKIHETRNNQVANMHKMHNAAGADIHKMQNDNFAAMGKMNKDFMSSRPF